jgi:hypothetical protein
VSSWREGDDAFADNPAECPDLGRRWKRDQQRRVILSDPNCRMEISAARSTSRIAHLLQRMDRSPR